MSLVYNRHSSGLVVANTAMDEAAVSRALRRLDPRFVLQKRTRDEGKGGVEVYKVVCVVSDTYAPVVFTWMDEHGRPLPLSSALIDELERHMLGARNSGLGVDEHNERLRERTQRAAEDAAAAVVEDHRPYVERGRRGITLATSKKPRYWRREGTKPRSGGT